MDQLAKNILGIGGDKGRVWLADLPRVVEALATKWQLTGLQPLGNLTYHYVLAGFQADLPVIVKIGFDKEVLGREAVALQALSGYGCVTLLATNSEYGALLLKRIEPGHSLVSLVPTRDRETVAIACEVMQALHQAPITATFPAVGEWLATIDQAWDIPSDALQRARALKNDLLATSAPSVLLHGDLHHDNILASHQYSWVAIDPKGVLGEPAYEVGALLRNPPTVIQGIDSRPLIDQRLACFSQRLMIEPQRLRDWAYVQTVMAACWAVEDQLDPLPFLELLPLFV
jgi:streptomycin 6-kinase